MGLAGAGQGHAPRLECKGTRAELELQRRYSPEIRRLLRLAASETTPFCAS